MRICFMCQEDIVKPQGGTGTYVRNIAIALAARGHEIHVIARHRDNVPTFEEVDGVKVHRVRAPGPPVLYSPLYFQQARRKFLELNSIARFDLIQGNMPLMSSWGVRSAAMPPIVETVHCTVHEELRAVSQSSMQRLNLNEALTKLLAPILRQREHYLLQRATQVIAVSNGLKHELVQQCGYPAENVTVIPNGIDYAHFAHARTHSHDQIRKALDIGPSDHVILYLGRLMERKRVIDLVRAMPLIRQRMPDTRLVVVGRRNANAERIEQLAQALGLGSAVRLIDHVAYRDVPAYYAMADVYALPSAYEGFPFTILEAMAAGTPVVASRIPGIDEQIQHNVTGLLHPVGDTEAIAEQVLRVFEDQSLARCIADAARQVVESQYNWDTIGARTERVFETAMSL